MAMTLSILFLHTQNFPGCPPHRGDDITAWPFLHSFFCPFYISSPVTSTTQHDLGRCHRSDGIAVGPLILHLRSPSCLLSSPRPYFTLNSKPHCHYHYHGRYGQSHHRRPHHHYHHRHDQPYSAALSCCLADIAVCADCGVMQRNRVTRVFPCGESWWRPVSTRITNITSNKH